MAGILASEFGRRRTPIPTGDRSFMYALCRMNNMKPTAKNLKADEQPRSDPTSQPSSAVGSPAKPSPTPPIVTAWSEGSMPERPSNAVSNLPGFPAVHYHPDEI